MQELVEDLVEKLKGFKIYFALPAYEHKVDCRFLQSMLATQRLLDGYGIVNTLAINEGDCYIQRARNEMAAHFLKTDYTHLFFIDSDMGWEPLKALKLIAHDLDFVCGGYQTKNDNIPKTYAIDPVPLDGGWHYEGGLLKLRGAPTGFMCLKRVVFERIMEKYPELRYRSLSGEVEHAFFHCSLRKYGDMEINDWYGEDIDFSHKWIGSGGHIWCDPDIKFTHSGYKSYTCNLQDDVKPA